MTYENLVRPSSRQEHFLPPIDTIKEFGNDGHSMDNVHKVCGEKDGALNESEQPTHNQRKEKVQATLKS